MNYRFLQVLFLIFLFTTYNFPQTTFFIKYKSEVTPSQVEEKIKTKNISDRLQKTSSPDYKVNFLAGGLSRINEDLFRIIKVDIGNEINKDDFINSIRNDPSIEYIQPAVTYKIDFSPDDSLVSEQWALEKIGAFAAWDITRGSDSILISVIDTGIDYLHPDLVNKIFINSGESGIDESGGDKRSNNIDDDNNGFTDDWRGWDFVDRAGFPFDTLSGDYLEWDNDPVDQHSHGTFVSGIAAAETNNGKGIAGVAPNVKILNVRSFDPGGNGDEDDAAAAILYSVMMGAKVINMSWGDYSFSYVLRDIIRYAYSQNVVLVASSGNNNTTELHYPSAYPEVISVGNSSQEDFSQGSYGSTLDLIAPGTGIWSTDRNGGYASGGGTSASAPHVSAAAALILSINNFTNEEVKQIIKSTADDINTPGWDLRTGSGRLNLFKALAVSAPARVKINYPAHDYTTFNDTVNFNITVMSPYFISYDFMTGSGLNPGLWTPIISGAKNQVMNHSIPPLDISNYPDGDYTARILVQLNNGNTTEERINFFIEREIPQVELVGIGPGFYGNTSTIVAEVITDQRTVVRLYYRVKGSADFSFVTLDGFNTNSRFVRKFHYGFIPRQIIHPDTDYEIYLESINLSGLTARIPEGDAFFEFKTDFSESISAAEMPFSLPSGEIFENPVNFFDSNFSEILFNAFEGKPDTVDVNYILYQLENEVFIKKDSVINKIPVLAGDYNNNGLTDLVSLFNPFTFIDETAEQYSFNLQNKLTRELPFYPVLVMDLDKDGRFELLSNYFDSVSTIWKIQSDLSLSDPVSLVNMSSKDSLDNPVNMSANTISRNAAVTADLDGDGNDEIWFADKDGDLISFKYSGAGYTGGDSLIEQGFIINNNKILDAGDFDGDGIEEIAVLYETNSIAPLFLLRILNFRNNSPNIIYEKIFLDQSEEFTGFGAPAKIYQTVKFTDIDNDLKDELIINIFPYLYIFRYDPGYVKLVYFSEGVNSESIFSGDINNNGITEIGYLSHDKFKFYEFADGSRASVPSTLTGYSLDTSQIFLSWNGSGERYYIFRGETKETVILYDSTTSSTYNDLNVQNEKNYYYKVQAFDSSKEFPYSESTPVLEVFSHKPAVVKSVVSRSRSSVTVTFTEKMLTSIENPESFEVIGEGIPNSISPSDQYGYLLSFDQGFQPGEKMLIVKGLKDFYNSPVEEDTVVFSMDTAVIRDEFFITAHQVINPYLIKVIFNFEVDESSALNKNNYRFSPQNNISSISMDPDNRKTIFINLDGKKPVGSVGREYTLKVDNLFSSPGTGSILINSGSGSYIILTGNAENLSGVYVYPNPAGAANEKMTFANLPKKAQIIIFTISGERVIELEESDGDGGIDFNLKDEANEPLGSGIYIYRIVRLDDSNNEVEEKIGKFAVVR